MSQPESRANGQASIEGDAKTPKHLCVADNMEIQTPPAHDKDSPPAPLLILNAPSAGPVNVPSG